MLTRRRGLAASSAFILNSAVAEAADFPTQPVKIVVPYPPGGSTDVIARLLAADMSPNLGRPVLVENRAGGNTIIAAEVVARSTPDGHTVLMTPSTTMTVNPTVYRNLSYKIDDFAPVVLASTLPFALVVRPDRFPTLNALADAARAQPGHISYGTNGPTTLHNICMLMLCARLGILMQEISYRGDAAQLTDFLSGILDVLVVTGATAIPLHRDGRGRILAWTSAERPAATPDVPTLAELVDPDLIMLSWFGLMVPARTPKVAIERLNATANTALQGTHLKERLLAEGQLPRGGTSDDFGSFLTADIGRWQPILSRLPVSSP